MKVMPVVFSLLAFTALPALAQSPPEKHAHGYAHMDIIIEDTRVSVQLESPLANLISFEYAPKTAEQKREAEKMRDILNNSSELFVFSPAAQCKPQKTELHSEVLAATISGIIGSDENSAHKNEEKHEHEEKHDGEEAAHADIDAKFEFVCAKPEQLSGLEVKLFDKFSQLHELEVQMVTPKEQKSANLTHRKHKLSW